MERMMSKKPYAERNLRFETSPITVTFDNTGLLCSILFIYALSCETFTGFAAITVYLQVSLYQLHCHRQAQVCQTDNAHLQETVFRV